MRNTSFIIRTTLIVALGGFLFGFDASVISGVVGSIETEFSLNKIQLGWAVSCLSFTSALAMMIAGPLSDWIGRKKILSVVGLLYTVSAILSALAPDFTTLVVARMIGGLGVGASLILAPMYIAELSPSDIRGRMVSFNQLNIVLGFSAAYFANFFILQLSKSDAAWVHSIGMDTESWRWMLGIEALPAILYFVAMFLVPESPRWLIMKGKESQALDILAKANGLAVAQDELKSIKQNLQSDMQSSVKAAGSLFDRLIGSIVDFVRRLIKLFHPSMRLVILIGLIVGIAQQITGVNAIYFYAPTIFEQSGVGTDAAFSQAIWVGVINVVFTLIAMATIDRFGRKPLLVIGLAGIAISMILVAYEFNQASYTLNQQAIIELSPDIQEPLSGLVGQTFDDDVSFKQAIKNSIGIDRANEHESALISAAIKVNPILILIGILGFVASFAISVGPVMWVLFSEMFPNSIRGIAISLVGFINSVVSFYVQLIFPWELANLGNVMTFLIYGLFAVVSLILVTWLLPETKGKTLEELEAILVKKP